MGGAWCCPRSRRSAGLVAAGARVAVAPQTSRSLAAWRSPAAATGRSWKWETGEGWAWARLAPAPELGPGQRRRSSPFCRSPGKPGRAAVRKTASEVEKLRREAMGGCRELGEGRPSPLEASAEVVAEAAWKFLTARYWAEEG